MKVLTFKVCCKFISIKAQPDGMQSRNRRSLGLIMDVLLSLMLILKQTQFYISIRFQLIKIGMTGWGYSILEELSDPILCW